MTNGLIDSHCHLDAPEFAADRAQVLAAARAAGVEVFLVPGVERAGFPGVAELAAAQAGIAPAYGIHPLYVHRAGDEDFEALTDWVRRPGTVAVGEIGLDGFVSDRDPARQEEVFARQLRLAAQEDLPVVLHVRHAVEAVILQLKRCPVPGGIAHAFNGSRQQAETLLAMGFALGFGGAMTFSGSRRIRELAATLPAEAIVLETDAPDIPPQWAQGVRNEPANLFRFAEVLAQLRATSVAEIAYQVRENACRVIPRLRPYLAG
ncbi:MAG: TatD family hydrolase [Zoogloeaceae bacterium]|nr:TatD family hydrolase [Zoogloeaceae bacterium]